MYQSPISIYETAMQTIMEQRENAIFAKVQDAFNVQVDKEELLRALKYDRNQYEAGYREGKADAVKWIPVAERLPEDDSDVLAYLRIGEEGRIYPANYAKGMWFDCIFNTPATNTTTHWMPLPDAPKED